MKPQLGLLYMGCDLKAISQYINSRYTGYCTIGFHLFQAVTVISITITDVFTDISN